MTTALFDSLLQPRAVAIVGASDNPHKVGGRPLRYLIEQGYAGRVYPVHPRQASVQGVAAHTTLADLPERPDVAILCVGAEQAEAQLDACARLGIPNALLFASGYAEVGAEGLARQHRLVSICRAGGTRLLGPNSIGVASFDSGALLSFASIYSDVAPLDGPVAIVSQSGAFGVSAYALLRAAGIGVRCVAATGNEADLDAADFIAALAPRPGVRLLLLYLEDVKDTGRMRHALAIARACDVAVLAVRAGRSGTGRLAAQAHTGAGGAAGKALDALFEAGGCRTVEHLHELVESVPLYLDTWRRTGDRSSAMPGAPRADRDAALPASARTGPAPRIGIVSNSGAACVLAADAAERLGLALAALERSSIDRLDRLLPSFSRGRNPIDLTAMLLADPALLGATMACVMDDGNLDAAVLGLLAIGGSSYDVPRFAAEARAAAMRSGRPLVVFSPHPHVREAFAQAGVAVFRHEVEALVALEAFLAHRGAAGDASSSPPGDERSPSGQELERA